MSQHITFIRLSSSYVVVLFPLIEENKEVYMTPLKGIKATQGSKSTQQKTNRGMWIDPLKL